MSPSFLSRLVLASLLVLANFLTAQVKGFEKIALIRVSFQPDSSPGTTGDGTFLLSSGVAPCGRYTIDPPPHDRDYFLSQLKAVDHYFRSVSYGQFGLDLDQSQVFPQDSRSSYVLDHPMDYYHPLNGESEYERLVTELFQSGIELAVNDDVDLSEFDQVVVIHAGVGQDFSLPFLDPTPEDIPSTFIDQTMLQTYAGGPIPVGSGFVNQGIVLPETQNHLLYGETLFSELDSPCDAQYGLTGTFALMVGFAVGLPPLWDVESGRTGIGIFGLMDQGSNNGRGVVPAPPEAWTRLFAGWEEARVITGESHVSLPERQQNSIIKLPINQNEYFLVENRTNWFRQEVSIDSIRYLRWKETGVYPPFMEILMDSTGIERDTNDVIIAVPDYDYGLPASGLLIWHIDESRIERGIDQYAINRDPDVKGVDLEEADGAQDLGFISQLIPDPSNGYFGDMWFKGNREYERANPEMKNQLPVFGSFTHPDTRSNSGAATFLSIQNISVPGITMTFDVTFDWSVAGVTHSDRFIQFPFDFNGDGIEEIFGSGDSLWWANGDVGQMKPFYENPFSSLQFCFTAKKDRTPQSPAALAVVGKEADSTTVIWFEYNDLEGNFNPRWIQRFSNGCNIGYVQVQSNPQEVNIGWSGQMITVSQDTVKRLISDATTLCEALPKSVQSIGREVFDVILQSGSIATSNDYRNGSFIDLALVDLDMDGSVDILALDESGSVYGFDRYLNLKSGFPVDLNGTPPLLSANLLGDEYPEIIVQNGDRDIILLDWQGRIVSRFTEPEGADLRALGFYKGHSSLFTSRRVFQFESGHFDSDNSWSYSEGTPDHSRAISLMITPSVTGQDHLVDWTRSYAYPNPSYGEPVLIRVDVKTADKLKIAIYDIGGYPVETLSLNPARLNAVNEISWNLEGIPSGVYLARVRAVKGNKTEEKIIKIGVIR